MDLGDAADDLQSEAEPISIGGRRPARPPTVIADRKFEARTSLDADGRARSAMPHGVFDEIAQGVLDQRRMTLERRWTLVGKLDCLAGRIDQRGQRAYDLLRQLGRLDRPLLA